jgi:hypothetical protein
MKESGPSDLMMTVSLAASIAAIILSLVKIFFI